MTITEEIKNLDFKSATVAFMFFFSMLGPGLLILFHYQRQLFISLETFKLFALSLAITTPGFVVPFVFTFLISRIFIQKHGVEVRLLGSARSWALKHSFNNAVSLYLILLLAYTFEWSFMVFAWLFALNILLTFVTELFFTIRVVRNPELHVSTEIEDANK